LPYGITQCYLLPDTSEHTPPNLTLARQAGVRLSYPEAIKCRVELSGCLGTEMVCLSADNHLSNQ